MGNLSSNPQNRTHVYNTVQYVLSVYNYIDILPTLLFNLFGDCYVPVLWISHSQQSTRIFSKNVTIMLSTIDTLQLYWMILMIYKLIIQVSWESFNIIWLLLIW